MFFTDYDERTSKPVKDQASAQVPCGDFRPGEDDLQIIDFIRKFGLDSAEEIYKKSVIKVTGSNRFQTAYRVEKTARVIMPTRYVTQYYLSTIVECPTKLTRTTLVGTYIS